MRHPIQLPGLGLVESVTVVEWMCATGDEVSAGDELLTIETEKSNVVIEAPVTGVVEIVVESGPDLVPADSILGYIGTAD